MASNEILDIRDTISLTAAAPAPAIQTEHERIQALHHLLRTRFLSAVNDAASPDLNKQLASATLVSTQAAPHRTVGVEASKKRVARNAAPQAQLKAKSEKPSNPGRPLVELARVAQNRVTSLEAQFPGGLLNTQSDVDPGKIIARLAKEAATATAVQSAVEGIGEREVGVLAAAQPTRDSQPEALTTATNEYSALQPGPMIMAPPAQPNPAAVVDTHSHLNTQPAGHVEAFDWIATVKDAITEAVSLEGSEEAPATQGWRLARAADHWPTLSWKISGADVAIPLVSNNTAIFLSRFGDVALHSETGIVFGKLPAGWTAQLSGRADSAIHLNARNQPVVPGSEDVRHFVFLNVEPGAHVLSLSRRGAAHEGAVGVPVLAGASTYIDATEISTRSILGRVFEADQQGPVLKGAEAEVSVIGQSAKAVTRANGNFRLEGVTVVGNYPIFVETQSRDGYPHRYRLDANADRVSLYRMSVRQVQAWIDQLEGGVSPEAGLVVAAVPRLLAANSGDTLSGGLKSLLPVQTLTPETYSLSLEGDLQVDRPLEQQAPRFVSVQVPDGPAVSYVASKAKGIIWSQLIVAQPGVVNVIGPN